MLALLLAFLACPVAVPGDTGTALAPVAVTDTATSLPPSQR